MIIIAKIQVKALIFMIFTNNIAAFIYDFNPLKWYDFI
jgi:hypothetical protein